MSESREPPPLCPSNSNRMGTGGEVGFSNGSSSWTERFDLVTEAAAVLKARGHAVTAHKTWLEHGDSGFVIQPQLGGIWPLDEGGVRTTTTLQVNHPTLIPGGVFEYQHSTGDTVAESLAKGFDQWAQMDFLTLLDALRHEPEHCSTMVMTFPARDGRPERTRRAVLGPTGHMASTPPDAAQEHPFCPCCLLTNSFETFRDLIEADAFYGLRLFAMRNADGTRSADCRVNGDDWEKGAQALLDYVGTWPAAGFEARKQYVILQTVEHYDQAILLAHPESAAAYIRRGAAYNDKGDYDRAIAEFDNAIQLDPDSPIAWQNRGTAWYDKGDYDRAIADFGQVIRLDPNAAYGYAGRAAIFSGRGDYDRAIADLDRAIRLDPKLSAAYNNRGFAYNGKGDYDRAIADLDEAIRLDPNRAEHYGIRGRAYKGKGDYDRAIVDLDQAIRLDPKYAKAYAARGEAYEARNDPGHALADFDQALTLDPSLDDARRGRERMQELLAKRSSPGAPR